MLNWLLDLMDETKKSTSKPGAITQTLHHFLQQTNSLKEKKKERLPDSSKFKDIDKAEGRFDQYGRELLGNYIFGESENHICQSLAVIKSDG